jgi:predicted esterase
MRRAALLRLLPVFLFLACTDRTGPGTVVPPRIWNNSFAPTLVAGYDAIQLGLILYRPAIVSFAIYSRTQSSIDAEEIRAEAAGTGTGTPIRSGTFRLDGANGTDTLRFELNGFSENSNLFIYLVADPLDPDPAPSDLDRVVPLSITTARRQVARSYLSPAESNSTVGYYLYLPSRYYLHPEERYPLVVFLHGAGEKGNGGSTLSRVLVNGPPKLVAQGRDFPFVLISPQLPDFESAWPVPLVDEIIARASTLAQVDSSRIYLTGLSLGGIGTWGYAIARPSLVAAVVPIAGAGAAAQVCAMRTVGVWAFHGDADSVVPVSGSVSMVDALDACSPAPSPAPLLTIYLGVGHDSWTRTYDGSAGHDIYTWMLQHQRSSP